MAEDKQFEATPRRKQQARQKGQVPRSRDLTSAATLAVAIAMGTGLIGGLAAALKHATAEALGHLHEFEPTREGLHRLLVGWGGAYVAAMAPLLLVVVGCTIALNYAQGGMIFTAYPITPRLDKLNPLTALKRILSTTGLVEALKSLLKVALVALVATLVLRRHAPEILLLGQMELSAALAVTCRVAWELSLTAALAMTVLGAADYLYQRFEHNKSVRMTREEMRQEMRETEGDPHARGQRKRARERLLRDGINPRLAAAAVVLANPTHVAVALYYGPQQEAPVVVARGRGRLAAKIKQAARRYGVPVEEEPALARALYKACPLGATIPPGLYQAVAVILARLYQQAAERRRRKATA